MFFYGGENMKCKTLFPNTTNNKGAWVVGVLAIVGALSIPCALINVLNKTMDN